jgi:hypothetical protein
MQSRVLIGNKEGSMFHPTIRMTYSGGKHSPVILCNLCSYPITHVDDAVVLYGYCPGRDERPRPDDVDHQIIVHKRSCQREVKPFYKFSQELSSVLVWLSQNLEFTGETREAAEVKAGTQSRF